jgi:hypothetical protein
MSKYLIVTNVFNAFKDYINSILKGYEVTILKAYDKDTNKDNDSIVISINKNIDNIRYVINMEQNRGSENQIKKWLADQKIVLNYNTYHVNTIKDKNHYYLPYQINLEEIDKLKRFGLTDKKYDVIICTVNSDKRSIIYNKLLEKGVKVYNIGGWEDRRDIEIAKGKILLNIHYNTHYKIYESLRCDRWLLSGMMVITENSIDDNELDVKDLLIIEKYDNLVDKVIEVLLNYEKYYNNYESLLLKKKEEIILNRKNKLNTVLNLINHISDKTVTNDVPYTAQ